MARLQVGFSDSVRAGSFSLPIRLTPIDVPLSTATVGTAKAWVRDLAGILGALGYGLSVHDDAGATETRFKGFFCRVRN